MSDDLISKQAAIEILNKYGYTKNMRIHKDILSIPPAREWIPVTERLPEEHEDVLTSDSVFGITFDSIHNGKWRKQPVAWMPLPEPYKEKENE